MYSVSVVVPVYNTDRYLEKCIDSVLAQEGVELILIDDGSSDKSVRICRRYACLPNVRFFPRSHMGVACARNYGIKKASGKYIMFLDSDDYLLPGVLSVMADEMESNHLDLVIGNYRYLYGEREQVAYPRMEEGLRSSFDAIHYTCISANKLYRRDLLLSYRIKYPQLRMGEDLCFYHRYLSICYRVKSIENDIFVYRMYEGSSSKVYDLRVMDFLKAFQMIEETYKDYPYMKKEFTYDEMFYLYGNLKKLPRYGKKEDRLRIYDAFQKEAYRHQDCIPDAMAIRKKILSMSKWRYCGTLPVYIHQGLRKVKHKLRGVK